MRDKFLFHKSWANAIMDLPKDIKLEVYEAIVEYGLTGTERDLKPMVKLAFGFVKKDIDKDKAISKMRSFAGRIGGGNPHFKKGQENPYYDKKDKQKINKDKQTEANENKDKLYNIYRDNNKKEKYKKEKRDLIFPCDKFVSVWKEWVNYKQDLGKGYKTQTSEQTALNKLAKLSDNNPNIAKLIVEQSIVNEWKGLFALQNNAVSETPQEWANAPKLISEVGKFRDLMKILPQGVNLENMYLTLIFWDSLSEIYPNEAKIQNAELSKWYQQINDLNPSVSEIVRATNYISEMRDNFFAKSVLTPNDLAKPNGTKNYLQTLENLSLNLEDDGGRYRIRVERELKEINENLKLISNATKH